MNQFIPGSIAKYNLGRQVLKPLVDDGFRNPNPFESLDSIKLEALCQPNRFTGNSPLIVGFATCVSAATIHSFVDFQLALNRLKLLRQVVEALDAIGDEISLDLAKEYQSVLIVFTGFEQNGEEYTTVPVFQVIPFSSTIANSMESALLYSLYSNVACCLRNLKEHNNKRTQHGKHELFSAEMIGYFNYGIPLKKYLSEEVKATAVADFLKGEHNNSTLSDTDLEGMDNAVFMLRSEYDALIEAKPTIELIKKLFTEPAIEGFTEVLFKLRNSLGLVLGSDLTPNSEVDENRANLWREIDRAVDDNTDPDNLIAVLQYLRNLNWRGHKVRFDGSNLLMVDQAPKAKEPDAEEMDPNATGSTMGNP